MQKKSDEFLYIQTNDFYDELTGIFPQKNDETLFYNKIKKFSPTLIISLNASGITNRLVTLFPNLEYKVWFIDNPWRIPEHMLLPLKECQNLTVYGASDSPNSWLVTYFGEEKCGKTLFFCSKKDLVTDPIPFEDRKYDFSYIGSLWNVSQFGLTLQSLKPNSEQFLMAKKLITDHFHSYKSDLVKHFREIFPESTFSGPEIFALFDDHCSSYKRLSIITELAKVTDKGFVAGNSEWWTQVGIFEPGLSTFYSPEVVQKTERLFEIYRDSKIGLNISHHQTKGKGMPLRCFDLLSSGVILVTNTEVEKESGLIEGKHYFLFKEADELAQIYKTIINDQQKYLGYAIEAQSIIRDRHTFQHRANSLTEGYKKIKNDISLYIMAKNKITFDVEGAVTNIGFVEERTSSFADHFKFTNRTRTPIIFLLLKLISLVSKKPIAGISRYVAINNAIKYLQRK